jgi:hypothetical protein
MDKKEMYLICGNFEEDKLPPEKQFLKKYFKNKPHRIFLNYYDLFKERTILLTIQEFIFVKL